MGGVGGVGLGLGLGGQVHAICPQTASLASQTAKSSPCPIVHRRTSTSFSISSLRRRSSSGLDSSRYGNILRAVGGVGELDRSVVDAGAARLAFGMGGLAPFAWASLPTSAAVPMPASARLRADSAAAIAALDVAVGSGLNSASERPIAPRVGPVDEPEVCGGCRRPRVSVDARQRRGLGGGLRGTVPFPTSRERRMVASATDGGGRV